LYYYAHYEPGSTHNGQWTVDIPSILNIPVFSKRPETPNACYYTSFSKEAFQTKRSELETLLKSQGMSIVEGFSAQIEEQIAVYQKVFSKCTVKSIAETGFNAGHSALLMLMSNPFAEIQSFDIGHYNYAHAALTFLHDNFPERKIQVDWGDSTMTVPAYHAQNPDKTFDIVIVDGGHSYEVATADIINMKLLSNADTLLIVDDTPCQEWYCVDKVIAEQEQRGFIKVIEKHAIQSGRGFLLAKYIFT
jgi:predicted O-methyltransferase YrrM